MLFKIFIKIAFLFAYIFLTTLVSHANYNIPSFFDATYTIQTDNLEIGLMKRSFYQKDEINYIFKSEFQTTGMVSLFKKLDVIESSQFHITDMGIRPLIYTYKKNTKKKQRDVEIIFDWEKQKITNRVNNSTWYMKTEIGVLDKLLYQFVIMMELRAGHIQKKYAIADGGKIKHYLFDYLGDEEIKTPLGKFKTMKIARHKPNKEQKDIIWLAYELGFFPVKVKNTDKNKQTIIAIIESLNVY